MRPVKDVCFYLGVFKQIVGSLSKCIWAIFPSTRVTTTVMFAGNFLLLTDDTQHKTTEPSSIMFCTCGPLFCAVSMFGLSMDTRHGRVHVNKRLKDEEKFIENGKSLEKAHVGRVSKRVKLTSVVGGILDDIKVTLGGSKRLGLCWTLLQFDAILHLDWNGSGEQSTYTTLRHYYSVGICLINAARVTILVILAAVRVRKWIEKREVHRSGRPLPACLK